MGEVRPAKIFIGCGGFFLALLLGIGLLINTSHEQEAVAAAKLRDKEDENVANAIQRAMRAQQVHAKRMVPMQAEIAAVRRRKDVEVASLTEGGS